MIKKKTKEIDERIRDSFPTQQLHRYQLNHFSLYTHTYIDTKNTQCV